jgi:hypothetical protein
MFRNSLTFRVQPFFRHGLAAIIALGGVNFNDDPKRRRGSKVSGNGLRRPGLAGRAFQCGDSVGKPSRWPVQPGFFIISRNSAQFSQFSQFCRWRCQLVVTGAV